MENTPTRDEAEQAFKEFKRPDKVSMENLQLNPILCSCSKKVIPADEIIAFQTDLSVRWSKLGLSKSPNVVDRICRDCEPDVRELCRAVCLTCGEVVTRFTPYRDPKTGFAYKKGQCYHLESCPSCQPPVPAGEDPKAQFFIEFQAFYTQLGKKL